MKILMGPVDLMTVPHFGGMVKDAEIIHLGVEKGDIKFDPANDTFDDIILRLPAGWRPDVVIWWSIDYGLPPEGLERCELPLIAMVGDWNLAFSALRENLKLFDFIYTDRAGVEIFKAAGYENVSYFPLFSYDTKLHRLMPEVKKSIDVSFIGNFNHDVQQERSHWLKRVALLADRYEVRLLTNVYGDEYARILNASRIVFNRSIRGEMNMRAYEAAACQSLMFYEEENLEVRDYYADREHCVLYNDRNFDDLIAYYLGHPDERERIARAGFQRVQTLSHACHLENLIRKESQKWLSEKRPKRRWFDLGNHERLFQRGILAFQSVLKGSVVASEKQLKKALDLYPAGHLAWNALGVVYANVFQETKEAQLKDKLLSSAKDCLGRALKVKPGEAMIHANLGQVLWRAGDAHQAEQEILLSLLHLADVEEVQPEGYLYFPSNYNSFRVQWEKVASGAGGCSERESSKGLLLQRNWETLGDIYCQQERLTEAMEAYEHSLTARRDMGHVHRKLAQVLQTIGKPEEALKGYADAIDFAPFDFDARARYCRLAAAFGKKADASRQANEALTILKACPNYQALKDVFQPFAKSAQTPNSGSGNGSRRLSDSTKKSYGEFGLNIVEKSQPSQRTGFTIPKEFGTERQVVTAAAKEETCDFGKKVSIVLLASQGDRARRCIKYLRKYTPTAHEIIVVAGNAGDEELMGSLQPIKGIRLFSSGNRQTEADALDYGASLARGDSLVFMHDDVVVTKHWLERMMACARATGSRSVVAPCSNVGVGEQRYPMDVGTDLDKMERIVHRLGVERRRSKFDVEMISCSCFLISRKAYLELGHLAGSPDTGKDIETYLKVAREKGFHPVVAGDAYVHALKGQNDASVQLPEAAASYAGTGTISLCMIVKDEEDNLPRCLASAKDFVDEIVVVDTGSKDRTVEIAQNYGARVVHFEWCNDFSAARNFGIEHATSEWVLIMDADEVLELKAGDSLRKVALTPRPRLTKYSIRVVVLTEKGKEQYESSVYSPRLFPNHSKIRYVGNVHEQVDHLDGNENIDTVETDDIGMVHYGYLPEQYKAKNKDERNLQFLEEALRKEPENAFHWFNLGQQHYTAERYEESLACFKKAIKLTEKSTLRFNYIPVAYSSYICALLELGRSDEAIDIGLEAIRKYEYTGINYNLAAAYLRRGDYEKALEYYEKAITSIDSSKSYLIDVSFATWRPKEAMAIIHSQMGNHEKAYRFMGEALTSAPARTSMQATAAQMAINVGRFDEAAAHLWKAIAVDPDKASLKIDLAKVFIASGNEDDAKGLLAGFVVDESTASSVMEPLLKLGLYEKAIEAADLLLEAGDDVKAFLARGLCLHKLGQWKRAEGDLDKAVKLAGADGLVLDDFASALLQAGEEDWARKVFEKSLTIDACDCQALVGMAKIDMLSGEPNTAVTLLERALPVSSNRREVEDLLIRGYRSTGRIQEAYDLLDGRLETEPGNVDARCELANLLMDADELQTALVVLGQGLDSHTNELRLYERLGAILSRLERHEDAKNAYGLALDMDPTHPGLREAMEAMEILASMRI